MTEQLETNGLACRLEQTIITPHESREGAICRFRELISFWARKGMSETLTQELVDTIDRL